jgi:nucleoid-associated protein YgaU
MASRYAGEEILNNDSSFYRFLRKMRQNQKNIKQYKTQILHHPRSAERMAISKDTYIWSIGDHFYNLAAKYYGDPTYWWVIAWYNGTPTEADVSPGTIIQIPTNLEEALRLLGL